MEISNRTAGKFQKITLYRAFQRKGALVAGLLQRTEERGIVFPVPGLGEEPSVFGAGDMGMGQQAPVTGKGRRGAPVPGQNDTSPPADECWFCPPPGPAGLIPSRY